MYGAPTTLTQPTRTRDTQTSALCAGNSPVMINKHQFATFVDTWVNVSLAIKQDEDADKAWGWVQEM